MRGRTNQVVRVLALGAALLASGSTFLACSDDEAPHDEAADTGTIPKDSGVSDTGSGTDTAPGDDAKPADTAQETEPECYTDPKTHYEIINACTDAAKLDKTPTGLPFLPDGGLPPP